MDRGDNASLWPAKTIMPEQINDLLNPGYLETEIGWCHLPSGAGFIANRCHTPTDLCRNEKPTIGLGFGRCFATWRRPKDGLPDSFYGPFVHRWNDSTGEREVTEEKTKDPAIQATVGAHQEGRVYLEGPFQGQVNSGIPPTSWPSRRGLSEGAKRIVAATSKEWETIASEGGLVDRVPQSVRGLVEHGLLRRLQGVERQRRVRSPVK